MLDIYKTLLKTCLAQNLQYRFALLIWLIGFILEPTIYMVVWMTVAHSQGGVVGGFTAETFAAYFLVTMLCNHLTFDWHFFEMEQRVRNGSFAPLLLKPLHPIHSDLCDNAVYKLLTFPFLFAAAAGLWLYFRPSMAPSAWALALLPVVLLLGWLMRFVFEWTLALTAFWTTRVQAIAMAYITVAIFLNGRMAPLSLLNEHIQPVAYALPFRLWISFPAELLLGRMSVAEALRDLSLQVVWLGVILIVFQTVWRRGARRFSAVGA